MIERVPVFEALIHLPVDLNHLGFSLRLEDAHNLLQDFVGVKYCINQCKNTISDLSEIDQVVNE